MATSLSIKIALVAILGGVGSIGGPVVGAVILTAIEETTRALFGGTGRGTDLVIYALLIIGVSRSSIPAVSPRPGATSSGAGSLAEQVRREGKKP